MVEDHLLQRLATEALLESQAGLEVVFSGEQLPELVEWLGGDPPADRLDLLLLDLVVDRGDAVDPSAVEALVQDGVRVLVVSALTIPQLVRQVLRVGVSGVVGKRDSEADLLAAVGAVLGRRRWITPELAAVLEPGEPPPSLSEREERTLVLYASGHTLDAVAVELGIRRETAKTYLNRVKQKYAAAGRPARTKVELARAALRDGYLSLPATEHL